MRGVNECRCAANSRVKAPLFGALISRPGARRTIAHVQLALVMIARNEARCIERCLTSVRPRVDAMVVLDTGSDDDTPQREARRVRGSATAPGADDFAAARNAALAAGTDADWRLVLDADEWLVDGAAAFWSCAAARRHRRV